MIDFPKLEEKILKFWQKNKIFEKSLKIREKSPSFIFYEGPPFANAKPGIHHVLARSFKDIIARYKTMRGYKVERRAGWDTHGLPVEMEVEKKMGIKTKPEIEKMGLEKFIKACRESIFTYKKEWEEMTERIAFWLDLKNAYLTCSNEYIESVWWVLKQIWEKGLIYRDYKVLPYCPRCGTSLSDHEVAQGYKEVEDPSIVVKFSIFNSQFSNSYFLAWTTTPWTLLANTALAIGKDIDYLKVRQNKKIYFLAKDCLSILEGRYQILEKLKGRDLIGLKYTPPFNPKSFRVVPADFVSTDEGTGIVHIAPAFGEEDLDLAKKEKIPIILNVDEEGKFKEGKWKGKFVKEADREIIFDLEKRGLLYKKAIVRHIYPFCWRCETPLLYYAKNSWYIKTASLKEKMLKNNEKINWFPSYIKYGRFGNWLKENIDWALSRERYWGTPLPIWICQKCHHIEFVGCLEGIRSRLPKTYHLEPNFDLHRPYIDQVKLKCPECQGLMKRVPEVIDCWFDSGSMPFAQGHWPFAQIKKAKIKNKKLDRPFTLKEIRKLSKLIPFPADFIAEGIDQTRGWFYTLLATSTLLGLGPSYKNVISLGLVLDEKGRKMSKSKGNVIYPEEIISKYGADATRLYFYLTPLGETIRFSQKEVEEVFKKFIVTLYNSYLFFKTYAPKELKSPTAKLKNKKLLDAWILSKLNQTIKEVTLNLEKFEITKAARLLYSFVLDDLSNWYIRRSRKREDHQFYQTLYKVLLDTCKLSGPFVPFISEEIYQGLTKKNKESVHLEEWPKVEEKLIDKKLNKEMELVRKIVELGHALRALAKIKVRQPLSELKIENLKFKNRGLLDLIADELNVKKVRLGHLVLRKDWLVKEEGKLKVGLKTKITSLLKQEGLVREIVRHIQEMRKEMGIRPKDFIKISYQTEDKEILAVFKKFEEYIKKETKTREMVRRDRIRGREIEIEKRKIWLNLKKKILK